MIQPQQIPLEERVNTGSDAMPGTLEETDFDIQKRVLIVDDEPNPFWRMILNNKGYEVVFYESGPEAIKAAKSGLTYDVALVDLTLGDDMDGKEVIMGLKEVNPHTPTGLISGYLCKDLPEGADFALAKPFTNQELVEIVDSFVNGNGYASPAVILEFESGLESRSDYNQLVQVGRKANILIHDLKNVVSVPQGRFEMLETSLQEQQLHCENLSGLGGSIEKIFQLAKSVNSYSAEGKDEAEQERRFAAIGSKVNDLYLEMHSELQNAYKHLEALGYELKGQDQYAKLVSRIRGNFQKVSELNDNLGTITAEALNPEYSHIDISEFIAHFADGIEGELNGINLVIDNKCRGTAYIEPISLNEALRTLIHNARHALNNANRGYKGTVWVTAMHEFFNGQHMLSLGVHDNGPGFNGAQDKNDHGTRIGLPYVGEVTLGHGGLMKKFDATGKEMDMYRLPREHGASVVVSIPMQKPTLH